MLSRFINFCGYKSAAYFRAIKVDWLHGVRANVFELRARALTKREPRFV